MTDNDGKNEPNEPAAEPRTRSGGEDPGGIAVLIDAMEAAVVAAKERHLRLARFNFILRCAITTSGASRIAAIGLEQLPPWLPNEPRYPREFLPLGEILLVPEEDTARSLFGVAADGTLVGWSDGSSLWFGDVAAFRRVAANALEVIRVFEVDGDVTISVQGFDGLATFIRLDHGRHLGPGFLPGVVVYRTGTEAGDSARVALESTAADSPPTVRYEFESPARE